MSRRQCIVALGIALLCSVLIWFAAPFNDLVLANAFISDDFMPVGAVGFMLALTVPS